VAEAAGPGNSPAAPKAPAITVKVTSTPGTGFAKLSRTVALSLCGKGNINSVLCGVPPVAAMLVAAPDVLPSAKLAGAATPATLALTVKAPVVPLAIRVGAIAIPAALVVAVAVVKPPKAPLAPELGAVNVTVTPEAGFPKPSWTVACNAVPNAVPTTVVCGVPPVATMLAGAAAMIVNEMLTAEARPGHEAVSCLAPIRLTDRSEKEARPEVFVT
jgi:hypothetical protein